MPIHSLPLQVSLMQIKRAHAISNFFEKILGEVTAEQAIAAGAP